MVPRVRVVRRARAGKVRRGTDGGADAAARLPRVDGHESFLVWMARAAGPVFWVIGVMSIYLFALVFWMALRYRAAVAMPRSLVRELESFLEHKRYSEAYHHLAASRSLLARVLAAGVRKLPSGLPAAQRAMELANEDATMEMEHRTTYLATVGTLGPMIGLVGTVYGMIIAFRVIATEGATPQASDLAKGISTALFSTLLGIGVSIPAIFFYSMFRNRIARLSLEVAMRAEPLLEQFAPGVRKDEPGPMPAAAPSPTPAQPPSSRPISIGGPVAHTSSLRRKRRTGGGNGGLSLCLASGRAGMNVSSAPGTILPCHDRVAGRRA